MSSVSRHFAMKGRRSGDSFIHFCYLLNHFCASTSSSQIFQIHLLFSADHSNPAPTFGTVGRWIFISRWKKKPKMFSFVTMPTRGLKIEDSSLFLILADLVSLRNRWNQLTTKSKTRVSFESPDYSVSPLHKCLHDIFFFSMSKKTNSSLRKYVDNLLFTAELKETYQKIKIPACLNSAFSWYKCTCHFWDC